LLLFIRNGNIKVGAGFMEKYNKLFVALKYYLYGRNYYTALKALEFARRYHTGTRKDGTTPAFLHQIEIALYITTLKDLKDEALSLTAALLHDVMEDYNISFQEMEGVFGKEITSIVWLLTKKHQGTVTELAKDPIASVVKGADRIHNIQTMIGVFSLEKQKKYAEEVQTRFLPMIKEAKRNFPEQSAAYFNIEHMLKSQLALITATHRKP
jgi:(p)ppGpp synthase/HD superfamily hydrolase